MRFQVSEIPAARGERTVCDFQNGLGEDTGSAPRLNQGIPPQQARVINLTLSTRRPIYPEISMPAHCFKAGIGRKTFTKGGQSHNQTVQQFQHSRGGIRSGPNP